MHPRSDACLASQHSPLAPAGHRSVRSFCPPSCLLSCLLSGLVLSTGCSLTAGRSEDQRDILPGSAVNVAGASGIGGERPPGMGGSAGTAGSGGNPGIGGSAPIAGAGGVGGSGSPPPQPTGEIATRQVDELRELTAVLLRDPLDSEQE